MRMNGCKSFITCGDCFNTFDLMRMENIPKNQTNVTKVKPIKMMFKLFRNYQYRSICQNKYSSNIEVRNSYCLEVANKLKNYVLRGLKTFYTDTRSILVNTMIFLYRLLILSMSNIFLLYTLIFFPLFSISMAFCPKGCICDDNIDLAVRCIDGKMDVVPILLNPNTLNLDLSHNRIKTIMPGFAFYHELKVLNVSYNELVSLGEGYFMSQKNLSNLIIRNNKISKLESRAFEGLSSMKELDVSYNYIESVHSNTFRYISKLKKLNLSGNRIRALDPRGFQNLANLRELNLCKNLIGSLSREIFEPLKNLKILLLCSNDVTTLHDNSFGYLHSLVYLSLENNHISQISKQSLSGLQSLKQLNLRDNLLDQIPTEEIGGLESLEDLNLSLNTFNDIGAYSFDTVTNLRSISVSHCPNLTSISDEAFVGLDSLVSLELNFNPNLIYFNVEILRPLGELRRLDLRSNGIESLDKSLLSVGNLQYVDLRDNQFHCSCSLKWLQQARSNKTLGFIIEDATCKSPEGLRGRTISSVTDYELRCYGHLITVGICVTASIMAIFFLGIAFIIYYKNCRKMKSIIHDNWPDKIVTTWKDSDYQKPIEDDEYTFHSLHGIHHIPIAVRRPGPNFSMAYPNSNTTTLKMSLSDHQQQTPKTRLMKSLTMTDTRQDSLGGNRKTFRTNSQIEDKTNSLYSEIEGPYSSISIANGIHRNYYENPKMIGTHLYNPSSTLYAHPNKPRTFLTGKRPGNNNGPKISKDSGYYSCEFLVDQSSHCSPPQTALEGKNGTTTTAATTSSLANCEQNPGTHYNKESATDLNTNSVRNGYKSRIPASDSGVFTLSRTYSRPLKDGAVKSPSESIYDNIL